MCVCVCVCVCMCAYSPSLLYQVATYNLSLAIALHGLITAGHPSVLSLADSIAAKWVQEVQDKDSSPNQVHYLTLLLTSNDHCYDDTQVLSVLWGLAGMLGVNPLSRLVGLIE